MPSRSFLTRYAIRFRPHLSTFSIFAPFSVAVCSSVAMILSISGSGVSGWQIKIRSYWRSSMMSSIPFLPCYTIKSCLLRAFVLGGNSAVVPQHRLFHALSQNQLDRFRRFRCLLLRGLSLCAIHLGQQVILAVIPLLLRLYAHPHAN